MSSNDREATAIKNPENFIQAVNTLLQKSAGSGDDPIPKGWNEQPPLLDTKLSPCSVQYRKWEARELKRRCREEVGVPPVLRGSVWIQNVMRATAMRQEDATEFGQNKMVAILQQRWEHELKHVFPHEGDESYATIPTFGLCDNYDGAALTPFDVKQSLERYYNAGQPISDHRSLTRLICTIHHSLPNVEYAPLLFDVAAILLTVMLEAHAYATLRHMVSSSPLNSIKIVYMPTTQLEHYTTVQTFTTVFTKLYPRTAANLAQKDILSLSSLDPIFKRFCIPLLPIPHVLHLMDLYTLHGVKILYRAGTALLLSAPSCRIVSSTEYWNKVKELTHSSTFDFQRDILKKAFKKGVLQKFPTRRKIEYWNTRHEEWASQQIANNSIPNPIQIKPMVFLPFVSPENDNMDETVLLVEDVMIRSCLAEWVPVRFQSRCLQMVFSTQCMCQNLKSLYTHLQGAKPSIMLVKLCDGSVIGMYASEAWSEQNGSRPYGNGECFLFRVKPHPKCYKWSPQKSSNANHQALLEQFMLSNLKFISMGGSKDGYGLRLNEDLSKGSSRQAVGFENEPLGGKNEEFDIDLVELYIFT